MSFQSRATALGIGIPCSPYNQGMKNAHLVEQHAGLAMAIAKDSQVKACHFELSDLLSIANWGLVKAALSFNGKGEFRNWASWKIRHEIIDYKRYFGPISRFGGFKTLQPDYLEDGTQIGEGQYEMHGLGFPIMWPVRGLERSMTRRESQVMYRRFKMDMKHQEIADELGVNFSRVSQIEKSALKLYREAYRRMGITRLEQVL